MGRPGGNIPSPGPRWGGRSGPARAPPPSTVFRRCRLYHYITARLYVCYYGGPTPGSSCGGGRCCVGTDFIGSTPTL
eukprot:5328519-Pyramimonas_sp.AAC.1